MEKELLELLKKHNLTVDQLTPEQVAEIRTRLESIKAAGIEEGKKSAPPADGGKPKGGGTDAGSQAQIDQLAKTVSDLAEMVKGVQEELTTVTGYVGDQRKTAEETQKAAQLKQYNDAVEAAVKDGRLTRAAADDLLKDEARDKNMKALDVFTDGLNRLQKDPRLANQKEKPQGGQNNNQNGNQGDGMDRDTKLRRAAEEEMRSNMEAAQ